MHTAFGLGHYAAVYSGCWTCATEILFCPKNIKKLI